MNYIVSYEAATKLIKDQHGDAEVENLVLLKNFFKYVQKDIIVDLHSHIVMVDNSTQVSQSRYYYEFRIEEVNSGATVDIDYNFETKKLLIFVRHDSSYTKVFEMSGELFDIAQETKGFLRSLLSTGSICYIDIDDMK